MACYPEIPRSSGSSAGPSVGPRGPRPRALGCLWFPHGTFFIVFCTFGNFTTCFTRNAHLRPGPSCNMPISSQQSKAKQSKAKQCKAMQSMSSRHSRLNIGISRLDPGRKCAFLVKQVVKLSNVPKTIKNHHEGLAILVRAGRVKGLLGRCALCRSSVMVILQRLQTIHHYIALGHNVNVAYAYSQDSGRTRVKVQIGAMPDVVPHGQRAILVASLAPLLQALPHHVVVDRGHTFSDHRCWACFWLTPTAGGGAGPSGHSGGGGGPGPGDGTADDHTRRGRSPPEVRDSRRAVADPWSTGARPSKAPRHMTTRYDATSSCTPDPPMMDFDVEQQEASDVDMPTLVPVRSPCSDCCQVAWCCDCGDCQACGLCRCIPFWRLAVDSASSTMTNSTFGNPDAPKHRLLVRRPG